MADAGPGRAVVEESEIERAGVEPAEVERVAGWLGAARAVTVLTGAGISTESGIPDFRGPDGVWTRDPSARRTVDLRAYVEDPDLRRRAWRRRLEHPAWTARPNAGHRALVELGRSGRLRALLTQNIDGLHQAAGSDPADVVELHGTLHEVECLSCDARLPTGPVLDRVRAGDPDPACRACGGLLKTATVSFGQALRPDVLAAAAAAARDADVFLAVGTSLTVRPVAALPALAVRSGARLVVVGAGPTPYDAAPGPYDVVADARLRSPIGRVLPLLVAGAAAARAGGEVGGQAGRRA